jgi:hypothetical protein
MRKPLLCLNKSCIKAAGKIFDIGPAEEQLSMQPAMR